MTSAPTWHVFALAESSRAAHHDVLEEADVATIALVLVTLMMADPSEQAEAARARAAAHMTQANLALRGGRYEDAIDEYKAAQRLFPNVKILYMLGQAYEQAGRKREALEIFRSFLRDIAVASEGDRTEMLPRVPAARAKVATLETAVEAEEVLAQEGRAQPPDQPRLPPSKMPPTSLSPPVEPDATNDAQARIRDSLKRAPATEERPQPFLSKRGWALGIGGVVVAAAATFFIISSRVECAKPGSLGCI